eukprot:TRINITY_DN10054_c0_g6_i1.p1 TRINITY_DN10054_c0_g6~~TRINITY_DN10054_c0_g6_i1.p1  ORF type:complete len:217 (+),score=58.28 TRINITY_DN10054_c0_g6_i1:545-1195(+)
MSEFNNELAMLNTFRHPNIVLMLGVVSKPPNLCILTEFLGNGSLFQLLHKFKGEVKTSARLVFAKEVAIVINYLHQSRVIHRDIKSHNVLLGEGNKSKLCDFGLARHVTDINQSTMVFAGTPTYMAPELFLKKGYDEKIDVFSYGTLLWEILEREIPHDGLEVRDIMHKVCNEERLEFNSNPPKKLQNLVHSCRLVDPRKRPTMKEVLDVLSEFTS